MKNEKITRNILQSINDMIRAYYRTVCEEQTRLDLYQSLVEQKKCLTTEWKSWVVRCDFCVAPGAKVQAMVRWSRSRSGSWAGLKQPESDLQEIYKEDDRNGPALERVT